MIAAVLPRHASDEPPPHRTPCARRNDQLPPPHGRGAAARGPSQTGADRLARSTHTVAQVTGPREMAGGGPPRRPGPRAMWATHRRKDAGDARLALRQAGHAPDDLARSRRSAASTSRSASPDAARGATPRSAPSRTTRRMPPAPPRASARRSAAPVDEAQADAARERHADGELLGGRVDGGDAVEARGDGPQRVGGGRAEREAVSPPVARVGRLRVSRQQRIRGTRPPVPGSMLDQAGCRLLDPRGRERRLEARRPHQQDQPELRTHRETRRGRPEKRSAGTSSSLAKMWTRSSKAVVVVVVVAVVVVVVRSPCHDASLVTVLTSPSAKTA